MAIISPDGWVHCKDECCPAKVLASGPLEELDQGLVSIGWHVFPDGTAMCYNTASAFFAEERRKEEDITSA